VKNFILEMSGNTPQIQWFESIMQEYKIKVLSTDLSYNIDKDIKVYNFVIEISDKVSIEDLSLRVSGEENFISYRMLPM